ncbi:phage portal protein [Paenibacillus sp. CGMCC 1.16610]|uniref:Phage portal protein n=1 Tax=Paenibacillus anseongense TaxID=2682845 RepID=A0ABW9U2X6_9BACL|nr:MULTISPECIES: phage portal protein [Paenibacillus]MBA2943384.1 phage portal protein [Paenibacillus sp. CGMCC 1.16610]MVQ33881.1 phage portal protein [Paenibacillus anseongense]
MTNNRSDGSYDIWVDGSYALRNLIYELTLEEALDEISYRAQATIVVTPDFPGMEPGQDVRVVGIPYGSSKQEDLLHPAVVWQCENSYERADRLTVTMYDRTIYLAKSEDEFVFPAGMTASERIRRYATGWNINVGDLPDTKVKLAKSIYRAETIYNMIMKDLKETARKGGPMYRPRMTINGLEIVEIGSNSVVWSLEPSENVMNIMQKRTLEGAVTKVKVLGTKDAGDEGAAQVLVIEEGEYVELGTLQKIVQDSSYRSISEAKEAAKAMLSGIQETISVTSLDINTIRAGDKVDLAGSGMELIAMTVRHELGDPGKMVLELGSPELVRRRFYMNESV